MHKVLRGEIYENSYYHVDSDPNDERFNGVHWAPLDAEHPSYLRFDEDIQIVQGRIHEERAAFWRDLVKRIKDHESKLTKVESET